MFSSRGTRIGPDKTAFQALSPAKENNYVIESLNGPKMLGRRELNGNSDFIDEMDALLSAINGYPPQHDIQLVDEFLKEISGSQPENNVFPVSSLGLGSWRMALGMFAPQIAKAQTKTDGTSTNNRAHKRPAPVSLEVSQNPLEQAHVLQRTVGNQALSRLLLQRASNPGVTWHISKIPIFATENTGQPPASTSAGWRPSGEHLGQRPLDPAPFVANRQNFSRLPVYPRQSDAPAAVLQRACACGGRCPTYKAKEPGEQKQHLQAKHTPGRGWEVPVVPDIVHEVLRSDGQMIDQTARGFFEARFGRDFGRVRVHTDARASESAEAVNALAYTVGSHVVFGAGQYRPSSEPGQKLLAHELSHVVQQSNRLMRGARSGAMVVSPANEPSEYEADRVADAVLRKDRDAPVLHQAIDSTTPIRTPTLQRQTNPQQTPVATQTAAQQCQSALAATTTEAVRQIASAQNKLNQFAAEQVYPLNPADPQMAEHGRVAAYLTAIFNTTEVFNVEAIAYRLARLGRALSGGEVHMDCGIGCGAGVGGSIIGGQSRGPFQFTLCGINQPPADLAKVMIHECAHAVLPDVGVTARPSTAPGAGVLDRAYRQERLFSHLSPVEAMTNAESYSELVAGLLSSSQPGAAPGASDTITQCSNAGEVESALGRAQVASRMLGSWLDGAVNMLQSSGATTVSTIPDPFVNDLQAAFPTITTLTDLGKMANDAGIIFANFITPEQVRCTRARSSCPSGRLGFVDNVAITPTALVRLSVILDPSGAINLCPDWSTASDEDRVVAMYAVVATSYLGGAMIQILRPQDALKLARFAVLVVGRYLPTPVAHSATEHLQ